VSPKILPTKTVSLKNELQENLFGGYASHGRIGQRGMSYRINRKRCAKRHAVKEV